MDGDGNVFPIFPRNHIDISCKLSPVEMQYEFSEKNMKIFGYVIC